MKMTVYTVAWKDYIIGDNKDPTKKDEYGRKGKEVLKITRSQKARKAV